MTGATLGRVMDRRTFRDLRFGVGRLSVTDSLFSTQKQLVTVLLRVVVCGPAIPVRLASD
jgi:hypothetical protein